MATETIIVDYQARVAGLIAELKVVQKEMKTTEESGVKAGKSTEDSFKKTEKAATSLRSQIRALREQLANATDPKDVEKYAKALGKLTDQMEDAGDAARVFASESKFEQMGSALGSVGSKLRNMDFKGAADQSKLLVSVSKSLTFKEAVSGVKDMGTTLFNIGKSLLMNPIFLIGAAVIGIIANFDKLKNSGGIVGAVFKEIGGFLGFLSDKISDFANAIGLIDSSVGQFAEQNKKMFEDTGKFISDINKQIAQNVIDIKKANGEISDYEAQKLKQAEKLKDELLQNEIARTAEIIATKNITAEQQLLIDTDYGERRLGIYRANSVAIELIDSNEWSRRNKESVEAQKIINSNLKKAKDDSLKALKKLDDDSFKEFMKRVDENAKKQEKEKEDAIQSEYEKQVRIVAAGEEKIKKTKEDIEKEITETAKKEADKRNAIQAGTYQFIKDAISAINEINQNNIQSEINGINEVHDKEVDSLDSQLKNKSITQEQYQKRKDAIDKKAREEESKLKRKAFESDKAAAIIQTVINTAMAVVSGFAQGGPVLAALAAVTGALQLAIIASQPTPKFAKGGLVGGKLHSEGGTLIEAQRGEFVNTIEATNKYKGFLEAANKGGGEKYIQDFYIAPILRAQLKKQSELKESSFASNIANSLALNSNFKDVNIVEGLNKIRRSERENAIFIAKALSKSHNSRRP